MARKRGKSRRRQPGRAVLARRRISTWTFLLVTWGAGVASVVAGVLVLAFGGRYETKDTTVPTPSILPLGVGLIGIGLVAAVLATAIVLGRRKKAGKK